jgi:ABC-type sugar transport system ATPase subunit
LRAVGDRVTILRDGETVHSCALKDLPREELIRHMVGREVSAIYSRQPQEPGEEMLRLESITRHPVLKNISLRIHAGEIVGLAGLIGAGRTELCRAVFGLDPVDSGRIYIRGKETRIRSPRDAVRAGLALVPEDRQKAGLARALPVGYNITLANLRAVSNRLGVLSPAAERRSSLELIGRLRIKAESPRQLAGRLSGGNQQKVVIARWLHRGARVFLFDEPTRGIDVGAKVEVFETMDQLARDGAALLMVSSELPELIQVADRIVVMREGELTGHLPGQTTQEEIMHLATRQ